MTNRATSKQYLRTIYGYGRGRAIRVIRVKRQLGGREQTKPQPQTPLGQSSGSCQARARRFSQKESGTFGKCFFAFAAFYTRNTTICAWYIMDTEMFSIPVLSHLSLVKVSLINHTVCNRAKHTQVALCIRWHGKDEKQQSDDSVWTLLA